MSIGIETRDVPAAGGLVMNRSGEFLMILRNGVWDLPKGHVEEGEDLGQTAIRETAEETGVEGLEEKDLICTTEHWYFRDCIWCHKFTSWFFMTTSSTAPLVPQREEGISEVRWVSPSDLDYYLNRTYATIREVFRTFQGMKLIG
ncbi:MAG: NUDIX domain-containing protein [Bacteroidales bacterium]|nr:NUDIX domain-containing protein [Bacteroidales bacterium]